MRNLEDFPMWGLFEFLEHHGRQRVRTRLPHRRKMMSMLLDDDVDIILS